MPSKNTLKVFAPNQYYHVYNRGWNKTRIFIDDTDYRYFEYLIARCFAADAQKDPKGREYKRLRDELDLNAYCLMPNHFHMLLYQRNIQGVTHFIQSICTAYSMYFNKKYQQRGSLFEDRFKAVEMITQPQFLHISRYIHLNHPGFTYWLYSSYRDYLEPELTREWVSAAPILELFDSVDEYRKFVLEYEQQKRLNDAQSKNTVI